MIDEDITHQIIGCAMRAHSTLGAGFPEVIYQNALGIELRKIQLPFVREVDMPIYYHEEKLGSRRVDFLVAERICVELKAVAKLDNSHLAQGINYLEAHRLEVGLLINFGGQSLEFKRLFNRRSRSM
jgi:GxxExxY protein